MVELASTKQRQRKQRLLNIQSPIDREQGYARRKSIIFLLCFESKLVFVLLVDSDVRNYLTYDFDCRYGLPKVIVVMNVGNLAVEGYA